MSSSSDAERALASAAAAAASSSPTTIDPLKAALFAELLEELLGRGDSLVLYDGICLVCNRFIQFVADRDPGRHMHFAPLQSELGQWIIQRKGIPPMDSMLLIAPGTASAAASVSGSTQSSKSDQLEAASWFCRTNAALRILLCLHPAWLWSLLWILLLIPAFLRDPFYKLFASLRYRLFGFVAEGGEGGASCRMVTKAERPRYLEYVVKDREKERKKREKEAATAANAATAVASSTTAPVSASASAAASSSLLDAPPSDEICAQTDHELELQHGHTHSPPLRASASPEQAPEEIAPLSSAKQVGIQTDELKQRRTKGAAETSS